MPGVFQELGLSDEVCAAVKENGFITPTPVQIQTIPLVLEGKDVRACAQTGTGKTAAFLLPLLETIRRDPTQYVDRSPRFLILTPTRELAIQVFDTIDQLKGSIAVRSALAYGGVGINPQKKAISKGCDFLVATPGRLIDLMSQRVCNLSHVEVLILDEADRMLDMGFMPSIKRILAKVPADRQTLLFSATFSPGTEKLCKAILKEPVAVEVSRNSAADSVQQTFYKVPKSAKPDVIRDLIVDNDWDQVLIFTRTRNSADKVCKFLLRDGFKAKAIHGDKSQKQRTDALSEFKDGTLPILVATDVAARGLDIEKLPQVLNYEMPENTEDYVHRIGRVGRAGSTGEAYSLISSEDMPKLKELGAFLKRNITTTDFPGLNYENYRDSPKVEAVNAKKRPGPKNKPNKFNTTKGKKSHSTLK